MNKELDAEVKQVWDDDRYDITFWKDGNFTICTIFDKHRNVMKSVGVTKRNPNCDMVDSERGESIAVHRAVKAMWDWVDGESDMDI